MIGFGIQETELKGGSEETRRMKASSWAGSTCIKDYFNQIDFVVFLGRLTGLWVGEGIKSSVILEKSAA